MDIRTALNSLNSDDEKYIRIAVVAPAYMVFCHKCNIFESERIFPVLSVYLQSLPAFQEEDFLLFIAYSSFEYQS